MHRVYDGSGAATTLGFDFKGYPLGEARQLFAAKTDAPDWSPLLEVDTLAGMTAAAANLLDAETSSASSTRAALGRVLTAVSSDGSAVHYQYDEGGQLQRVSLNHRGSATEQTLVDDIRLSLPTASTRYTYVPLSQRLLRLRTLRTSADSVLQSLHYHHDPVGNVTDAQATVYFANAVVEAANSYDSLYRVVEATGREHASEGTGQRTHDDLIATAQPMTSDPSAMRRYTYDQVGNLLELRHTPSASTGWTRRYQIADHVNRLLATSAPREVADQFSHGYAYDPHCNMIAMPHLAAMAWNHDDELEQAVAGSETVWFQYARRVRARKFTQKPGTTSEERIYLGPFEIYRKCVDGNPEVEREFLHISDDSGRVCLVETKTIDESQALAVPTPIWRCQLSNHLGSATTEITETGAVRNHEEYHAFATSAYRAVNASIDVSASRHRYTGMERDDETGLGYHSARYYASWLARWTAAGPIGLAGGINRFAYCDDNPVDLTDPSGHIPPKFANAQANYIAARRAYDAAFQSGNEVLLGESSNRLRIAEQHLSDAKAVATAYNQLATTGEQIVAAVNSGIEEAQQEERLRRAERQHLKNQQSIGADGVIGIQAEHRARRLVRENNVMVGPTLSAIAYAGGEGVSLETAELMGNAEAAVSSMARPLVPVTGRSTVPQMRADRMDPPRTDNNVEHIPRAPGMHKGGFESQTVLSRLMAGSNGLQPTPVAGNHQEEFGSALRGRSGSMLPERKALETFEDDIIDRLFVLNAERAEDDRRQGLGAKPKKSSTKKTGEKSSKDDGGQTSLL